MIAAQIVSRVILSMVVMTVNKIREGIPSI
jgi:hypothetical protein